MTDEPNDSFLRLRGRWGWGRARQCAMRNSASDVPLFSPFSSPLTFLRWSLCFHPGLRDERAPLFEFRFDFGRELLRRVADNVGAFGGHAAGDFRRLQRAPGLGVETRDD